MLFWFAALLTMVQATFAGSYRDWMLRLIERQLELLDSSAKRFLVWVAVGLRMAFPRTHSPTCRRA